MAGLAVSPNCTTAGLAVSPSWTTAGLVCSPSRMTLGFADNPSCAICFGVELPTLTGCKLAPAAAPPAAVVAAVFVCAVAAVAVCEAPAVVSVPDARGLPSLPTCTNVTVNASPDAAPAPTVAVCFWPACVALPTNAVPGFSASPTPAAFAAGSPFALVSATPRFAIRLELADSSVFSVVETSLITSSLFMVGVKDFAVASIAAAPV